MSIYDKERAGRPINPARALYSYWHTILSHSAFAGPSGHLAAAIWFGQTNYARRLYFVQRGPCDKPDIGFAGEFALTSAGEFQVNRPWGYGQRDALARNTFLDWTVFQSEYIWKVNTDSTSQSHSSHFGASNWEDPVHYLSERVMGCRNWRRPWLKLVWSDEFGWHMAFSRNDNGTVHSQEILDRYDALRRRRYRLMERKHLIRTGVLKQEGRSLVDVEERNRRQNEAAEVLAKHMAVHTAARTVPLRKTTEEVGLWEPSGLR